MDNKTKNEENVLENVVSEDNSFSSAENVSKGTPSEETVASNEENITKSEKRSDSLESILRRFKRQSSGIVAEIKKREAYEKPSVKRKKKSEQARRKKGKFSYYKW